MKRIGIFIDASNLWAVQKSQGKLLDLKKLIRHIEKSHNSTSLKIYYYDSYPAQASRDYDVEGKFRFYVYLKKNLGIIVRKKPLKQIKSLRGGNVTTFEKGNMDVEIALDFVNQINNYDIAILFSGDSDFLALLRFARSRNKKVHIYSSRANISRELRTGSDGYTDILKIEDDIWGKAIHRRNTIKRSL